MDYNAIVLVFYDGCGRSFPIYIMGCAIDGFSLANALPYGEFLAMVEPFGFTRTMLDFGFDSDSTPVYISIDGKLCDTDNVQETLINALTNIVVEFPNFSISYGLYLYSLIYSWNYFCVHQYCDSIYLHRDVGKCYISYRLDDGQNHAEYDIFFNKQYYVNAYKLGKIYIHNESNIITEYFEEYINDTLIFTHVASPKSKRLIRKIKLGRVFN